MDLGNVSQHSFHQVPKSGWPIAKPKQRNLGLLEPLANGERGLWACLLGQFHLPVAASEMERAEPTGPRNTMNHLSS